MKIDASRYMLFWSNPERYRLREIWKLAPIEPKSDSFAALLTFGRRRGTCFHEILDGAYRGVPEEQVVQSLKDGGFGDREITVAKDMALVVRERYGCENYLAHESVFEYPIPRSPHIITGRIDHLIERDGETLIGDWKTTKKRTKKDFTALVEKYKGSPQVDFYYLGARQLGFAPGRFLFRVLQSQRKGTRPEVTEHFTERTGLQLRQLEHDVHVTCELIEWMKQRFGTMNPWPTLFEPFDRGYSSILGKKMYKDYTPDGFTAKVEHLSTMMDDEDEPEGDDAVQA